MEVIGYSFIGMVRGQLRRERGPIMQKSPRGGSRGFLICDLRFSICKSQIENRKSKITRALLLRGRVGDGGGGFAGGEAGGDDLGGDGRVDLGLVDGGDLGGGD